MRLFCFPYAGGNSLLFRQWRDTLPKNIEVCPVELPGRLSQRHIPPFTQMESIDEPPLDCAIAQARTQGFAIFGGLEDKEVSYEQLAA